MLAPPAIAGALSGTRLPRSVHRVLTGGGPVYPDVAKRFLDPDDTGTRPYVTGFLLPTPESAKAPGGDEPASIAPPEAVR